jgi:large exoprotein involved in heme utilization and adhesion
MGKGTDINISVRKYVARDGGLISSMIYQTGGNAGNLTINAAESIQVSGFLARIPINTTGFNAMSVTGGGKGGNISITTPDLQVKDGAVIVAGVYGGAGGGNIRVVADTISIAGENVATAGSTVISSPSFFGGNGGSVEIDTGRLFLGTSGTIAASTAGNGNAGNINIRARDSIEVDGAGAVMAQRSRISTSANIPPLLLRQSLGIPGLPTGNGGNLYITTPSLQVRNQGYIATENAGSGDAGQLMIQANSIVLDQQGQIRTATQVGQAGLLSLMARDAILLRHNSLISAKAGGSGNGGNITIDSPIIVGLENSDIIANAIKGKGGNVKINTQSLFGLQYRDRLTSENDITASSEFGISGNVQVNTIGINPANALNTLPVDIVDSSRQIADRCGNAKTSSFIATGRGGMPQGPMKKKGSDRTWNDLRTNTLQASTIVTPISQNSRQPIVEASAIEFDEFGGIALTTPKNSAIQSETCRMVD